MNDEFNLIKFNGIITADIQYHGERLDPASALFFVGEDGRKYICPLHGKASDMDDSRRFLLEAAHEIADMQNRNALRQQAAEFKSMLPSQRSVLDDLADEDDEDDIERYTAGDPDMEDSNLPF